MAAEPKEPLTFRAAEEVEEIAKHLIGKYHKHLRGKDIKYLFRSEPETINGKTCLGTARKVTGLNAFLAGSSTEYLQLGKSPYGSEPDGTIAPWPVPDPKGGRIESWPQHLRIREYPEVANV